MGHINTRQLRHLLELDENGQGLHDEFQALIRQVTSGGVAGKMTDPREIAVKRLWDRGFGKAVKARNFKAYLAGIPQIPAGLLADDADLPFLSLVDPRPGLLRSCKLLWIQFEELGYAEDSSVPFDQNFPLPTGPFWFRHDNGRKNRKRRPDHCRDELTGDIQAGSAMEGIFAYAHHPDIVKKGEHVIDLPGTVRRDARVNCAYLGVWDGQARLSLSGDAGFANPSCGALRLRRK